MIPESPQPEEEQLIAWLAACDGALAAGAPVSSVDESTLPIQERGRLRRDLNCVDLLRRCLGATQSIDGDGLPQRTSPAADLPSRIGRFEIRRELGQGGFGIVFLAFDPQLGREVALKIPRSEVFLNGDVRVRFQIEARIAAALDHPHIAPVYDAGEIGPVCYIASAYCPGPTLVEWLREQKHLPASEVAAEIISLLADAVQHAHSRGILHRDLKPGNIILTPRDRSGTPTSKGNRLDFIPRLTDFGLAKFIESPLEGPTRSNAVVGTPEYMAPEQASGRARQISTATDVYGLGAVLYELLTGQPPFRSENALQTLRRIESEDPISPRRLRLDVPRDLATICLKCLEKEPQRRYQSAHELAEDLRRFLSDVPVSARPVSNLERLQRWLRRNPAMAIASGLALAGLVATMAISIWFAVAQAYTNAALRDQTKLADERRLEADDRRVEAERRLAMNLLQRGIAYCRRIDHARGLVLMNQAHRTISENDPSLAKSIRRLMGGWGAHYSSLDLLIPRDGSFVQCSALAPDGQRLLIADGNGRASIIDIQTGKVVGIKTNNLGNIRSVAYSADGLNMMAASRNGVAMVWPTDSDTPRCVLRHEHPLESATFSPNGERLLTATEDGKVRCWEIATGKLVVGPLEHGERVFAAEYSPQGDLFATSGLSGRIQIWNASEGAKVGEPIQQYGTAYAIGFSPDSRTLAAGGPGQVNFWDLDSRKQTTVVLKPEARSTNAIAYGYDGATILTGHEQAAYLWNVQSGEKLATFPHRLDVTRVGFGRAGNLIYTTGDGVVRIWKVALPDAGKITLRHPGPVPVAEYSPDGSMILTGGYDKMARLSQTATGETIFECQHSALVNGAQFNGAGTMFVTVCRDGAARVWDVRNGRLLFGPWMHGNGIVAAAFSLDGKYLVTAGQDSLARFHNTGNGSDTGTTLKHMSPVLTIAFSPNSRQIATGCQDGTVTVWDANTGKQFGKAMTLGGPVRVLSFNLDGRFLLCAGESPIARLWSVVDGRLHSELRHQERVTATAWHPDGKNLLTASWDRTVREWNLETGMPIRAPLEHSGEVQDVAYSPDGETILTGCHDGTVQVWERMTGQSLGPPLRHGGVVWSVAFAPSGQTALSGATAASSGAHLWPLPTALDESTSAAVDVWTQRVTGMRMDSGGAFEFLDARAWAGLAERTHQQGR